MQDSSLGVIAPFKTSQHNFYLCGNSGILSICHLVCQLFVHQHFVFWYFSNCILSTVLLSIAISFISFLSTGFFFLFCQYFILQNFSTGILYAIILSTIGIILITISSISICPLTFCSSAFPPPKLAFCPTTTLCYVHTPCEYCLLVFCHLSICTSAFLPFFPH